MSANPDDAEPVAAAATSRSEPLYFPAAAPRLFGWLHRPAASCGATGVVICKPFGYELLCGHRSLRAFAEMAAAIGVPALRFDYQGSGDAAEIDPDADQVEQWVRDVLTAIDELRARTGVTRICLLGFRLGAMIATLAAARCEQVSGLVLVAPVISGKRYLRELRRQQLAARVDPAADDPAAARAAAATGAMEVAGHTMSAATLAALSALDLASYPAPHVAGMLILDRDDTPEAQTWYRSLRATGTDAEYIALAGFVGMMMTAPMFTVLPFAMLDATRAWLLQFAARPGATAPSAAAAAGSAGGVLTLTDPGSDAGITERAVHFGPDGILFGILSEPGAGQQRRGGVILLNNGADYHIGACRLHVMLGRHWARHGYAVLRMDLAGLGDSGLRPGRPGNEVFPATAMDDVRAAVDFMREQSGVGDLTMAGLCSGAYYALCSAAAALAVNRIFMINPETFHAEDAPQSALQLADVVGWGGGLRAHLLSRAQWRKALSGEFDLAHGLTVLSRRSAIALGTRLHALLRALRIHLPGDVSWQFEQIAQRGVRTTLVFGEDEPGFELLQLQVGSSLKRLGERCHVHTIEGADHTFTRSAARLELKRFLSDELFGRASQKKRAGEAAGP